MTPSLPRAAGWDPSDISCNPCQVVPHSVWSRTGGAVREIDFEELAAGQGMRLEPFLCVWALSCACVLLSAWCQLMLLLRALFQGISLHQSNESCARGSVPVHC